MLTYHQCKNIFNLILIFMYIFLSFNIKYMIILLVLYMSSISLETCKKLLHWIFYTDQIYDIIS